MALPANELFGAAAGPLGASWTQQTTGATLNTNGSGRGQASSSTETYAFWNADVFPNDQQSQIQIISGLASGSQYVELTVRASSSGATINNYNVYTDSATGAGHTEFSKWVAGTQTVLASIATTVASNDILKLTATGTSLSLFKNGTSIATTSDAALTSGSPGFGIAGSTSVLVDNWQGDILGGTATGTTAPLLGSLFIGAQSGGILLSPMGGLIQIGNFIVPTASAAIPGVSGSVTASSEDSSGAVGAERYTSTVGASSEDAAAGTLTERYTSTVGASSEDSASAAGAERYTSTATASSEDSANATGAERFTSTATASTEDSAGGTLLERFTAAVAASSEDYSGATAAERLIAIVASVTEDSADAVGALRFIMAVASSSEDFAAAASSGLVTGSATSSSEDSASAAGSVTSPSTTVGGDAFSFRPRYVRRSWSYLVHSKGESAAESSASGKGGVRIVGAVSAGSSTRAAAKGAVRIVGVASSTSASGSTADAEHFAPWSPEEDMDLLLAFQMMEMA